jgi:hypothetical protein
MLESRTAHAETIQTLLQTASKAPTYDRSRTLKKVGSFVESLEETLNCFIYEIGSKVQNRSEAVLTHHSWILGAGTHLDTVGTEERLPIVVFDYTVAKEDLKRIGELSSLLLQGQ